MKIEEIAETFALLMILEPETKTCQAIIKLAEAGTSTGGDTDISVLKEIKADKDEIEKELKEIADSHFGRREELVKKFLD